MPACVYSCSANSFCFLCSCLAVKSGYSYTWKACLELQFWLQHVGTVVGGNTVGPLTHVSEYQS